MRLWRQVHGCGVNICVVCTKCHSRWWLKALLATGAQQVIDVPCKHCRPYTVARMEVYGTLTRWVPAPVPRICHHTATVG